MVKRNISLLVAAFIFLGVGLVIGAYVANSGGTGLYKAEATDNTSDEPSPQMTQMPGPIYGYGIDNYTYYGGYPYGYGMGMGMMGMGMGMMPMYGYGYGMDNYTYYGGYPYAYGMGMGMMGPMYGYGYGMYNDTYPYYNGYYGGLCPGCGYGYGMYGYPAYYYNGTNTSSGVAMNMTSTAAEGKAVFLANKPASEGSASATGQPASASSSYTIAGLGTGFLVLAPISWKILNRRSQR